MTVRALARFRSRTAKVAANGNPPRRHRLGRRGLGVGEHRRSVQQKDPLHARVRIQAKLGRGGQVGIGHCKRAARSGLRGAGSCAQGSQKTFILTCQSRCVYPNQSANQSPPCNASLRPYDSGARPSDTGSSRADLRRHEAAGRRGRSQSGLVPRLLHLAAPAPRPSSPRTGRPWRRGWRRGAAHRLGRRLYGERLTGFSVRPA